MAQIIPRPIQTSTVCAKDKNIGKRVVNLNPGNSICQLALKKDES